MEDLFEEQLKMLRAGSLDRHLSEIGTAQGPEITVVAGGARFGRSTKRRRILVPAIRYPTVAKGSARLRITVTVAHQEDQIRSICEAIRNMTKSK